MPVRTARMLILTDAKSGRILLEKRPPSGIWGGLWSLPEVEVEESVEHVCLQRWGLNALDKEDCDSFRHTFSHYHLDITPCQVRVRLSDAGIRDINEITWCAASDAGQHALAAPIARIISRYAET